VEVELEDGVHLRVCLARASTVSPPHKRKPGTCIAGKQRLFSVLEGAPGACAQWCRGRAGTS
jgi:hypothetical protein